jgi:NADH-quinone oxidoreductase subunit J
MSFQQIVFYALSTILVIAGLRVITARNPVHAAMFLVLSFFTSAGLWLLLEAEFLAITLVLVYVGAVMVLFLFVVMMLDVNLAPLREGFTRYLPLGGAVAFAIVAELYLTLGRDRFGLKAIAAPTPHAANYSNTKELGRILYTDYVYAFEIAAAILLVAIIAAIALTMRKRPETKHQDPAKQSAVRRQDRVRLVKMKAESND